MNGRGLLGAIALIGILVVSLLGAGVNASMPAVPPLQGEMARLGGLVGRWGAEETKLAPDGSVREVVKGGVIEFEPALRGTYLIMRADAGNVDADANPIMWLFTFDAEKSGYVARGFTAADPHPGVIRGGWDGDTLVFVRDPEVRVPPVNFRLSLAPQGSDEIRVTLEVELEGNWITASRQVWRRIE